MRADPFDKTIEVLPDSRLRSRAVRRLQKDVDGEVERRLCLFQVAKSELSFASRKVTLGLSD